MEFSHNSFRQRSVKMNTADLFWTNLCLLGFGSEAAKYDDLVFEAEMFRRGGPLRALNVILHFCLNRADPTQCREDFKGVWPIYDKGQEKDFRKSVFARLQKLESSGELRADSVRLSDLTSAKGDRLYLLLLQLSSRALASLLTRLEKPIPKFPELSAVSVHQMGPRVLRGAALRLAGARVRLTDCVNRHATVERQLKQLATRVMDERPVRAAEWLSEDSKQAPAADAADADAVRRLWGAIEAVNLKGTQINSIRQQTLSVKDPEGMSQRYAALLKRLQTAASALEKEGVAKCVHFENHNSRAAGLAGLAGRWERRRRQVDGSDQPVTSANRLQAAAKRVLKSPSTTRRLFQNESTEFDGI